MRMAKMKSLWEEFPTIRKIELIFVRSIMFADILQLCIDYSGELKMFTFLLISRGE